MGETQTYVCLTSDFEAQFLYAAKNGYIERAERLLLGGNFDPANNDNDMVKWAAEHGHDRVVQVLLRDKRVDPTAEDHYCIQIASSCGHNKVLELLLEDRRCDPAAQNSIALWLACQNGHLECVRLLVQDKRVNMHAKTDDLTPLEVAVLHEHFEIGQYLLELARTETVLSEQTVRNKESTNTFDTNTSAPTEYASEEDSIDYVKQRVALSRKSTDLRSLRTPTTRKLQPTIPEKMEEPKNTTSPIQIVTNDAPAVSVPMREDSRAIQRQKLVDLVDARKSQSLELLSSAIKNMRPFEFVDDELCNQILQSLTRSTNSTHKDVHRGTTYDYVALLQECFKESKVNISEKTLSHYKAAYSGPKQLIRQLLFLRERKNPISLLEHWE
jgi:ankyrin repeat protein